MEHYISRSEKKRRAKGVEDLARELIELSAADVTKLPCDDFLKGEIRDAKPLKAGARKRQLKYLTKQLRASNYEPILSFLEEKKGSKLKQNQSFRELERLRDDIATEAIEAMREAAHFQQQIDSSWNSDTISLVANHYPTIDQAALKVAAIQYAKSRKPSFNREIFRILKACHEQQKYNSQDK